MFGLHDGVDNRMQGSFFWSIVSCCDQCTPAGGACSDKTSDTEAICVENNHTWTLVNAQDCPVKLAAKYDVHYPDTLINYGKNVSFIAGCDVPALPKENAFWSHSDFCPNWGYVKEYIQDLNATRGLVITMFSLLFVPIGAGIADKQGRKPILFFGFLMGVQGLLANLLASTDFFIHNDPGLKLLYASGMLGGMAAGGMPVQQAMMVDLIPGDLREQGFPVLALFQIPGSLGAVALAYWLLGMYLDRYTVFWWVALATDLICLVFVLFCLPESMPDQLRKPFSWWDVNP